MNKIFFAAYFLLFSAVATASGTKLIPAQIISNNNAKFPTVEQRSRVEWWVDYVFQINTEGRITNTRILDISDNAPRLAKDSLEGWLENLQYTPAVFEGTVVPSGERKHYIWRIAFYSSDNRAITPGYSKLYEQAKELILSDEQKLGWEKLQELTSDYSKNNTEQALTAWLKSIYYFKEKDWPAYGDALKVSVILHVDLPKAYRVKAIQNLVDFHMFNQDYASALIVAQKFAHLEHVDNGEQAYADYKKIITEQVLQATKLERKLNLTSNFSTYLPISMREITLKTNFAEAITVEKLCANNAENMELKRELSIVLSPNELKCALVLTSKSAAEVEFIQSGASALFGY